MTSDARVARSAVSYVLLFLLIFGLAGTVDHAEFRKQFKEKRALALGFFGQFVMLPFLGFCAVKAFDLASLTSGPGDANRGIEAVILLLTTSSPGGSYSNWWCFLFNADLALSVAMTTVSSIASVVMLPLNLAIYLNATGSTNIDVEYGPLSVAVAIVVAGIGAGLFASSKLPTKKHVFHTLANVSGLSLIALGFISTSGSRDGLFNQPWNFFVGCAAPCVLGIALATGTALSAHSRNRKSSAWASRRCIKTPRSRSASRSRRRRPRAPRRFPCFTRRRKLRRSSRTAR
jgi:sodium/bile acid cotransporter 2